MTINSELLEHNDYTACENTECSLRGSCYRAIFPWSEYQSVATFTLKNDGTCDHYLYEPGTDAAQD